MRASHEIDDSINDLKLLYSPQNIFKICPMKKKNTGTDMEIGKLFQDLTETTQHQKLYNNILNIIDEPVVAKEYINNCLLEKKNSALQAKHNNIPTGSGSPNKREFRSDNNILKVDFFTSNTLRRHH